VSGVSLAVDPAALCWHACPVSPAVRTGGDHGASHSCARLNSCTADLHVASHDCDKPQPLHLCLQRFGIVGPLPPEDQVISLQCEASKARLGIRPTTDTNHPLPEQPWLHGTLSWPGLQANNTAGNGHTQQQQQQQGSSVQLHPAGASPGTSAGGSPLPTARSMARSTASSELWCHTVKPRLPVVASLCACRYQGPADRNATAVVCFCQLGAATGFTAVRVSAFVVCSNCCIASEQQY
jgi:hypothetical protein